MSSTENTEKPVEEVKTDAVEAPKEVRDLSPSSSC